MAFIVFEGLDAAGKSTLIEGLKQTLQKSGIGFQHFRDPGSTDVGERIRNIILATDGEHPVPKAETLLYQAARVQMVDINIRPALQRGDWVLCDRFYSSTVAFQSYARGMDLKAVLFMNQFVAGDCPPDLFIYLDITVEESLRRKYNRVQESGVDQDSREKEGEDFHNKVRTGYLEQAKADPDHWLVLNAMQSPEQLVEEVVQELRKRKWLP
ncbi:MAG: dTMP kinase [Bdellovibrionales bacterium]|nr:dTMP kinase [Bdellovibrionales bacterium]